MEWKSELCLWTETILTPGSEFLMDPTSLWWIWTAMKQKFQKISSENMRLNWMRKILHADQRQKQKPQRRAPAVSSPRIVSIGRRNWIDTEPGKYSFSDHEVSKKVTCLLRHSQQVDREEDGAVHFWRIKENLQSQFPHSPHWSDSKWKVCLAGRGDKRRFQYCTDASGTIVYFRALQGHSGRNLIDSFITGQCGHSEQLLPVHISCRMCVQFAFYHQFRINTKRSKFKQKTDQYSFCLLILWAKITRILMWSTWVVPRHAQYLHKAWKKHQDAV